MFKKLISYTINCFTVMYETIIVNDELYPFYEDEEPLHKQHVPNLIMNCAGKFSEMVSIYKRQIPQGGIRWGQRLSSNNRGMIGASQMSYIMNEKNDIREFFKKTVNNGAIPVLNSNWGNLVENITSRYAEICHKTKIIDGVTKCGHSMSSCTIDGFSHAGNGKLKIWELKSPIFRLLRDFGKIYRYYVKQVETQAAITKSDSATYFEMKLVPCTVEQMKNDRCYRYTSFLKQTGGIEVNYPQAYGYIKISPKKLYIHNQYCLDPIIGGPCECDFDNLKPIEIVNHSQDEVGEILGLVKSGEWVDSFELVSNMTDDFINKLENEKCYYILPFVIKNSNTAHYQSKTDVVSLHADRIIVASKIMREFNSIVGKRFTHQWSEQFLDYLVNLYDENLKNLHINEPMQSLTKEVVIDFMVRSCF